MLRGTRLISQRGIIFRRDTRNPCPQYVAHPFPAFYITKGDSWGIFLSRASALILRRFELHCIYYTVRHSNFIYLLVVLMDVTSFPEAWNVTVDEAHYRIHCPRCHSFIIEGYSLNSCVSWWVYGEPIHVAMNGCTGRLHEGITCQDRAKVGGIVLLIINLYWDILHICSLFIVCFYFSSVFFLPTSLPSPFAFL